MCGLVDFVKKAQSVTSAGVSFCTVLTKDSNGGDDFKYPLQPLHVPHGEASSTLREPLI